jgi:very-short-patch-repair endonuclease
MPHSNIEPRIRSRARKLRKSRTLGEKAMQQYLRALRPLGAHFRREVPIGPYVVDFAWLSAHLIVEVDGASHRLPGRSEQDAERDRFLRSQGFTVIRVNDADAVANAERAFAAIEEAVRPRLKDRPVKVERNRRHRTRGEDPSPNPSPQGGGGHAQGDPRP